MIFCLYWSFFYPEKLEHTNIHMKQCLFFSPQVLMVDAIPGLINAIRMIHTISRYYSISENIRSLFVKVTMLLYCECC